MNCHLCEERLPMPDILGETELVQGKRVHVRCLKVFQKGYKVGWADGDRTGNQYPRGEGG